METNNNPIQPHHSPIREVAITAVLTALVVGVICWVYFDKVVRDKETEIQSLHEQYEKKEANSANEATGWQPLKPTDDVFSTSYMDPSLSWEDSGKNKFTISSLAYGTFEVAQDKLSTGSLTNPYYAKGQKITAIKVNLSLSTKAGGCLSLPGRMTTYYFIRQTEVAPINRQLYFPDSGGCAARANSAYRDLEIYFPAEAGMNYAKFDPGTDDPLYTTNFNIQVSADSKYISVTKELVSKIKK